MARKRRRHEYPENKYPPDERRRRLRAALEKVRARFRPHPRYSPELIDKTIADAVEELATWRDNALAAMDNVIPEGFEKYYGPPDPRARPAQVALGVAFRCHTFYVAITGFEPVGTDYSDFFVTVEEIFRVLGLNYTPTTARNAAKQVLAGRGWGLTSLESLRGSSLDSLRCAHSERSASMSLLVDFKGLRGLGIPYGRNHLRKLCRNNAFPKPIVLGQRADGRASTIAWRTADVLAWLAACEARSK